MQTANARKQFSRQASIALSSSLPKEVGIVLLKSSQSWFRTESGKKKSGDQELDGWGRPA
jgi:hypothetical protein